MPFREHQVSLQGSTCFAIFSDCHHSGVVLEKVCEYFYYNERNKDSKDVADMDIPAELCLELLMAADYLDSKSSLVEVLSCRS